MQPGTYLHDGQFRCSTCKPLMGSIGQGAVKPRIALHSVVTGSQLRFDSRTAIPRRMARRALCLMLLAPGCASATKLITIDGDRRTASPVLKRFFDRRRCGSCPRFYQFKNKMQHIFYYTQRIMCIQTCTEMQHLLAGVTVTHGLKTFSNFGVRRFLCLAHVAW